MTQKCCIICMHGVDLGPRCMPRTWCDKTGVPHPYDYLCNDFVKRRKMPNARD